MMAKDVPVPEELRMLARSRGRTFTEGEFSAMTNLTWTTSEIHTNKFAGGDLGGRSLAGANVLAISIGLASMAIRAKVEAAGVRFISIVGFDDVRFVTPMFPGDTVYCESHIERLTRTSKPGRVIFSFRDELVEHDGRSICRSIRKALCDVSGSTLFDSPT